MRKIRVMFVIMQLNAGGSERVVLDLARGLGSDQFKILASHIIHIQLWKPNQAALTDQNMNFSGTTS